MYGFGVYLAAVFGVFFARWWGPYRAGTLTLADFAGLEVILEVVGALIGGVLVMAVIDREARLKGKSSRWKERALYSFFGGVTIDTFIAGA